MAHTQFDGGEGKVLLEGGCGDGKSGQEGPGKPFFFLGCICHPIILSMFANANVQMCVCHNYPLPISLLFCHIDILKHSAELRLFLDKTVVPQK